MAGELVRLTASELALVSVQTGLMRELVSVWQNFPSQWSAKLPGNQGNVREPFPCGDEASALVKEGRALLAEPATEYEIRIGLSVLCAGFKWPGSKVIPNRGAFIRQMCLHLADHRYPAAIIYGAVIVLPEQEDWFPSIKEVVDACNRIKREVWSAIRYLEASPDDQWVYAYHVEMGVCSKQVVARVLTQREYERKLRQSAVPYCRPYRGPD
jgi:hypothetical protein